MGGQCMDVRLENIQRLGVVATTIPTSPSTHTGPAWWNYGLCSCSGDVMVCNENLIICTQSVSDGHVGFAYRRTARRPANTGKTRAKLPKRKRLDFTVAISCSPTTERLRCRYFGHSKFK